MRLFIFVFLLSLATTTYGTDPVNDVKHLKQTINTFAEVMMTDDTKPPSMFMFSRDELKQLLLQREKPATEEEITRRFEKENSRTTSKYAELKRDLGVIKGIVSYDTLTHSSEMLKFIDVSIVFTVIDRWDKTEKNARVLVTFMINNNKLQFAGSMRTISFLHFTLNELSTMNSARQEVFYKKNPLYFDTSVDNIIPFEKKGKWGLISLKNEILLPPLYDSIFPFAADYARVRIKGKYNLIDKNFKPIFPKPRHDIRLRDKKYQVADTPGKYSSYPAVNAHAVEEVEEVTIEMMPDEMPTQSTSGNKNVDWATSLRDQLSTNYYKHDLVEVKRSSYVDKAPTRYWIVSKQTRDTLSTHVGFDYIDEHAEYLFGVRNDTAMVIKPSGEIMFRSPKVCSYESPGYVLVFDRATRLFGLYCPYSNVYIKPIYAYIKPIDREQFFVVMTTKGKVGYLDSAGKELFELK